MKLIHPKKYYRLIKETTKNFFLYNILPDKWYLSWKFKKVFGFPINWKNPITFNEKINWLKIYDRKDNYHLLVDKLNVKQIIASLLGSEYVIPTILGPFSSVSEIDKEKLPQKFVLKCNHDAASVIVCKDKNTFNWTMAEEKLKSCLKRNYYNFENKQWAYKGIKPYIFVEQYMEDKETGDLSDYKFYCFNGVVKCIFVGRERFTNKNGVQVNLYDRNWNRMPFEHFHQNFEEEIERPENIDDMINIVEKLARYVDAPFIRIDMYNINKMIFFGEFTFYPGGGFESFNPNRWDEILGSWIDLSEIK